MSRFDGRDLLALAGVSAIVYGVSRWSVPAAWVVLGSLLLACWLRPHLRRVKP